MLPVACGKSFVSQPVVTSVGREVHTIRKSDIWRVVIEQDETVVTEFKIGDAFANVVSSSLETYEKIAECLD